MRVVRRQAEEHRRQEPAGAEGGGDADRRRRSRRASSTHAAPGASRRRAARRAPCGCRSRWSGARPCTDIRPNSPIDGDQHREPAEQRVGLGEELLLRRSAARPVRAASTRPSSAESASICRTASRTPDVTLAGSPAVRTSITAAAGPRLQVRHVHRRRRRIAHAVVFRVAQHADHLELVDRSRCSIRTAGRSGSRSGSTSCAAASLITTTFGDVLVVARREAAARAGLGISIVSKKFGEMTSRLMELSRSRRPGS